MFEANGKYTIYAINSMCFGGKSEITITQISPKGPVFKQRGKRKQYYLNTDKRCAVFKGWDLPFCLDSDPSMRRNGVHTFTGNACLNFVGDTSKIRTWMEEHQINPAFDREIVLAIHPDNLSANDRREEVVFPEAVTHSHAVVSDILKKQEERQ
ncbi:MAG: hypothetical protein WC455_09540 [Dehalococcoidia bacterium]|jgi:hypothetical protein